MEEALVDDQSHYEVSLTAGQAFLAFVLLLLSLAAAFAFGLLIGRGQGDDKTAVRKEQPAVISEAPAAKKEVAVRDEDFKQVPPATITEETAPAVGAVTPEPPAEKAAEPVKKAVSVAPPRAAAPHLAAVPYFAQLLSTSDQKTAETLAARLIDNGFNSAYVERSGIDKGTVYRVRVKFPSEEAAKAAETKLRTFSKDVWITK